MRNLLLSMVAASVSIGCGGGADFGSPTLTHTGGSCAGGQEGVVVLAWTIRGAPPTATSCQGIDHLEVDLDNGGCGVSIAPVPCVIDHWRYDHLPEGATTVSVTALSANGATVASGSASDDLTPSAPSSPTAINLQ